MLTLRDLLWGVALPAVAAAVMLVVAWQPWRREHRAGARPWAVPLALAIGFVLGAGSVLGWPAFPPLDSVEWLWFLALPWAAVGVAESLVAISGVRLWLERALLASVSAWLLLRPLVPYTWDGAKAAVWITGLAGAMLLACAALDRCDNRSQRITTAAGVLILAAASGLVLMLSGSQKLGQLAGALSGSLLGYLVFACVARGAALGRGGVLVFAVLWSGLLIAGHFYAGLTRLNALLLFSAPLLGCLSDVRPLKGLKRWQRAAAHLVLIGLPCGIAVALAALDFARSLAESSEAY